jgi:hypothetical protein
VFILGIEGLSAAETGLLRTILRLSSDLAGRWTLGEQGACDAVLFDPVQPSAMAAAAGRAAFTIPMVRRGAAVSGDYLERPVRAEDFTALLRRAEAVAKASGTSRTFQAVPTATPAASPAPAASLASIAPGIRGRLTRWPPAKLLGSGRGRIELATLLSRQARSARELATMTSQPEQACIAFMAELDQQALILWEATDASAIEAVTPRFPAGIAQGQMAGSLLRSIRRRLGLA